MLLNTKRKGKGKKPNKHYMTSLSHNTNPKSMKKCFFFSLLWCEVRWLCSITTIYQPCDRSRQGVWRGTLSGRSPSPCGRLLPRRRGFCDFAFSAYISFTPTHAIHSGTTTALRRAHIEHLVLHNGTACPFSHLVFLSLSLSLALSLFFSPLSPSHPLIPSFAEPFAITNVTVADNSLWCVYRIPTY